MSGWSGLYTSTLDHWSQEEDFHFKINQSIEFSKKKIKNKNFLFFEKLATFAKINCDGLIEKFHESVDDSIVLAAEVLWSQM